MLSHTKRVRRSLHEGMGLPGSWRGSEGNSGNNKLQFEKEALSYSVILLTNQNKIFTALHLIANLQAGESPVLIQCVEDSVKLTLGRNLCRSDSGRFVGIMRNSGPIRYFTVPLISHYIFASENRDYKSSFEKFGLVSAGLPSTGFPYCTSGWG